MRQLAEEKTKARQQAAREPIAIAIPAPTPEHKEVIAKDTTVKFFPEQKASAACAKSNPRR